MNTNLIFKRTTTVDGVTQSITKIVPVSIPSIDSKDGWTLVGSSDIVEVEHASTVELPIETKNAVETIIKFDSNVSGTAKLVRTKGKIKIARRRGKKTYNLTTPDCVCIDDSLKTLFFNDCRSCFGGGSDIYEFTTKTPTYYFKWNSIMEKEYAKQRVVEIITNKESESI